jgi:hypothetical protein
MKEGPNSRVWHVPTAFEKIDPAKGRREQKVGSLGRTADGVTKRRIRYLRGFGC